MQSGYDVLQPCSENLYLMLMKDYWKGLGPLIVCLMQETSGHVDADDLQAILRKDAG